MHRRSFLHFLLATPLAAVIDYEKLLWIPGEKTIFIPSPKQVEFMNLIIETPISLFGIPYHENDGSIGRWMRFERDIEYSYKKISLADAIKDGHVHGDEVPSITDFMKRMNNNA